MVVRANRHPDILGPLAIEDIVDIVFRLEG
jgi:hypothetical protein